MADDSSLFFSPTSPHFFQPLLPGFQNHLKFSVKFFSEHIEGKHEGKTVKLRSDASEKTWNVKMEGQRLTKGWKEFVEAHDLRIGDFVVFRQEQNMLFHVTALEPSCCEIQYAAESSSRNENEEEESDENERCSAEKNLTGEESNQLSSDLTCFTQSVTASNLSRDLVGVPKAFAKRNGLYQEGSQKMVLMNEKGKSSPSELKSFVDRVVIVGSWTSFCAENKLEVGDSCTFKLLKNAQTIVFRLCSRTKAERKKETLSAEVNIADKSVRNRFVKLTPTSNSLDLGKQHIPANFTRENGLIKPGKIILMDKDGAEWLMELKVEKRSGLMYIFSRNGWRSFCAANEVCAGESLNLELIRGGEGPLLKFCSKVEQPPSVARKRARFDKESQETRPKVEVKEKTFEEGEPSHQTRPSNDNLRPTQPCSVSDQVAKAKQSVVDTLTSIGLFREELETMKQSLEDSLQEINKILSK